jgi:nucleoside-diphosphate-sugar epimerase
MRLLVTGHDGYIGVIMTRVLQEAGHDVVGLDTSYFRDCTFGRRPDSIPVLERDIRDVTPADLRDFEAVVHLAALSNDPLSDLNPELTYEINYRASVRLAQAARAAGVSRFLYSSSCSVYGASGELFASEESSLDPQTAYAKSKILAEKGISALAGDSFSPVFMRNATAYGVSPQLRLDLVLNNLVGWAVTTGQIRILSDGTPWRPIVHIEDISRAFAAVLDAPRDAIHNHAFNVGGEDENYQVRDLAKIVAETVAGSQVEINPQGSTDSRDYRVSFAKMRQHLPGFKLKWNARAGAAELHGAFRTFGLTIEDLESGRRYIRLRQLRYLMDRGDLNADLRWVPSHVLEGAAR